MILNRSTDLGDEKVGLDCEIMDADECRGAMPGRVCCVEEDICEGERARR